MRKYPTRLRYGYPRITNEKGISSAVEATSPLLDASYRMVRISISSCPQAGAPETHSALAIDVGCEPGSSVDWEPSALATTATVDVLTSFASLKHHAPVCGVASGDPMTTPWLLVDTSGVKPLGRLAQPLQSGDTNPYAITSNPLVL